MLAPHVVVGKGVCGTKAFGLGQRLERVFGQPQVFLGADLDIYSIALSNTANGIYRVGGVNVYSNNDAQPWISFPINIGHAWLAKNNNLLQLAICSNISFTKYVYGRYHIDIPNQPFTEGDYSSTGSFIGLSFNYVFTNANYRIRKAYEKQDLR